MLVSNQRTILQACLYFIDRNPESIRDLYQEIVCNLWHAWPMFRNESASNTWVYRIAVNTAVSEMRYRAHRPKLLPLEEWMYSSIASETSSQSLDYYRLIDALDPEDRALLYLRLDRMSIRDIATTIGTTEAAVKQKLYRLRLKLDILKKQDYE
ncbi:MAG: sigma-70 family RNA polymerase sigma factor [Bacteroidales bacterium]|nr:sigma-70 family RNA polymerase sigma factor [Bacteroidales bacterium]